jgi:hypothetical protein
MMIVASIFSAQAMMEEAKEGPKGQQSWPAYLSQIRKSPKAQLRKSAFFNPENVSVSSESADAVNSEQIHTSTTTKLHTKTKTKKLTDSSKAPPTKNRSRSQSVGKSTFYKSKRQNQESNDLD